MPSSARRITLLETALLRRSVDAATAGRDSCRHCQRTPLVGERVHFYDTGAGSELVCDLCRPVRAQAPQRTELMHSPEHDRAVRVLRTAA